MTDFDKLSEAANKEFGCMKCGESLSKHQQGFDVSLFSSPMMYCENKQCDLFGLLTVAALVKKG